MVILSCSSVQYSCSTPGPSIMQVPARCVTAAGACGALGGTQQAARLHNNSMPRLDLRLTLSEMLELAEEEQQQDPLERGGTVDKVWAEWEEEDDGEQRGDVLLGEALRYARPAAAARGEPSGCSSCCRRRRQPQQDPLRGSTVDEVKAGWAGFQSTSVNPAQALLTRTESPSLRQAPLLQWRAAQSPGGTGALGGTPRARSSEIAQQAETAKRIMKLADDFDDMELDTLRWLPRASSCCQTVYMTANGSGDARIPKLVLYTTALVTCAVPGWRTNPAPAQLYSVYSNSSTLSHSGRVCRWASSLMFCIGSVAFKEGLLFNQLPYFKNVGDWFIMYFSVEYLLRLLTCKHRPRESSAVAETAKGERVRPLERCTLSRGGRSNI